MIRAKTIAKVRDRIESSARSGFVFLRFDNMEVIKDCEAVAESIGAFCVERARLLYGSCYSERRVTAKKRANPPLTPPGAGGG